MQGLWGCQHLPAWKGEEQLQGLRGQQHLPAWKAEEQMQGLWGRHHSTHQRRCQYNKFASIPPSTHPCLTLHSSSLRLQFQCPHSAFHCHHRLFPLPFRCHDHTASRVGVCSAILFAVNASDSSGVIQAFGNMGVYPEIKSALGSRMPMVTLSSYGTGSESVTMTVAMTPAAMIPKDGKLRITVSGAGF